MQLVLEHLPHLVPAAVGIAFLGRFALTTARLPPAGLSDVQLREWHKARRGRGVRRLLAGR